MKRVFMVFFILIAIIILSTVFTVDETRQVVILQLDSITIYIINRSLSMRRLK